jgi:methylphosphotriester-DNA--protein-cysteine methyltransferase
MAKALRLMKAIELLVQGWPVKEVAAELGYLQPSRFIELVRQLSDLRREPGASRRLAQMTGVNSSHARHLAR